MVRLLVYVHRWLGIAGSLLFVAWFASGIVLMYVGMPGLDAEERRELLEPLDLGAARVTPGEAAATLGVYPDRVRLGMFAGRPVYRLSSRGRSAMVFADSGEALDGIGGPMALEEVRRALPDRATHAQYEARIEQADQWTFGSRALMPLHRVALNDAAGTVIYLSDRTGEPVLESTRHERRWAYAGAVLHWLYFTPFRRHADLWAQSVIWLSIAGSLLCLSGLVWGIWRYSPFGRYRLKGVRSHSPYAGWMWWHHYGGLLFGLTTFTWIFSGLLSMDPWDWHPSNTPTAEQRIALTGGALDLAAVTVENVRAAAAAIEHAAARVPRELDLTQFQHEPFWTGEGRLVSAVSPKHGAFAAFDRGAIAAAVSSAMPGVPVEDSTWLEEYDAYYYDRHGERALPVLRVRYRDPQRTWLYADPARGQIVLKEERLSRLNRWLYHGLHSLDFPFLYYKRPLWDVVVIVLSLGGIAMSVTTAMPAWRRLRRHARRVSGASS